jgi:hypothetical protein
MNSEHVKHLIAEAAPELEVVAAKIRPLPENVIPSDEFLKRTRLRLLQLAPKDTESRQAA